MKPTGESESGLICSKNSITLESPIRNFLEGWTEKLISNSDGYMPSKSYDNQPIRSKNTEKYARTPTKVDLEEFNIHLMISTASQL
jgi:hypothetical protein